MTKTSGFRFWKVCSPKANSKVTDVDEERGARGKNEEGRGLRAVWERPRGPGPRGPGPRGRGAWAEGAWAEGVLQEVARRGNKVNADSASRWLQFCFLFVTLASPFVAFLCHLDRAFICHPNRSFLSHPGQLYICRPSQPFVGLHD